MYYWAEGVGQQAVPAAFLLTMTVLQEKAGLLIQDLPSPLSCDLRQGLEGMEEEMLLQKIVKVASAVMD